MPDERPKYIQLKDLAAEMGFSQAGMLRRVTRRGFNAVQLQSGSNKPYFLTIEDADNFRKKVKEENANFIEGVKSPVNAESGGVYIVEVPSYAGELRYKIGWADNFRERFSSYRSIVPDLRVIAVWRTYDQWTERMAHKVAMNMGKKVFTELFEFENSGNAINSIKEVFEKLGIPVFSYDAEVDDDDSDEESVQDEQVPTDIQNI